MLFPMPKMLTYFPWPAGQLSIHSLKLNSNSLRLQSLLKHTQLNLPSVLFQDNRYTNHGMHNITYKTILQ